MTIVKHIIENLDVVSLIVSIMSVMFAGLTYCVTRRTYNAQLEQIKNQESPNLRILSIETTKSHPDISGVNDGAYCRIYSGTSTSNISLDNNIATFSAEDKQIESGFIEEIKHHIGKKNVYFTYFGSNTYLIFNHATSTDRFIIDHSNAKITLHNYGVTISALSIKSLVIYYKPEMDLKSLTFNGDANSKITLFPDEDGNFVLFLDEVTTDLNNSTCQIPSSIYKSAPESFDLLRTHMSENILAYNKVELNLNCWDIYNNKTALQITLEYNGNFFISSTTVVK